MPQVLTIHPTHPQSRLLSQAVEIINKGGLVVYPTDTSYALACHLGDKKALERIVALRRLAKHHQFTLACRDLSELGTYARVDNMDYRLLKRLTPGPFTFILQATREVPKRLIHAKRKSIGIRVPEHPVAMALLEHLGEPLMTTTMRLPDFSEEEDELHLSDPRSIAQAVGNRVDLILDAGICDTASSTIVDLTQGGIEILRQGKGLLES